MASRRLAVRSTRRPDEDPVEFRPSSVISTSTTVSAQPPSQQTAGNTTKSPGTRGAASAKEAGTNIQVVIRCRAPSTAEIAEGTPVLVTTDGPRGQTVKVGGPPQESNTYGVQYPPQEKVYLFDHVFGPEAEQAMIYQDVVAPVLTEVLGGYNCTIFAYGQTGTGKTYTMQGDMVPTAAGTPSSEAGIIPRSLSRLFQRLEANSTDYSVKISYIELYNEELRDLLAPDLSTPLGDTQPMSAGQPGNSSNGLKIFDEASKKGVLVQGLEEFGARDAKEAIKILLKGSQRRQVASTKFNDHSSRSHSIFTVIVHVKETTSKGEEVVKIGRLNLVDLAGSENIGRSGAENKRAKEAGMINQSLLTLGRVINALVDKGSHVPYRESKLTRLLQDSLGGYTKTCIIATISPVKSNLEETLSTLDYAIRAKAIKNKPELNQRMTKNGLLKEYVAEIDRLKLDLLATREKNGRYFDEERWAETEAEHELVKKQHEESRRARELIESQLITVREEFEHNVLLLGRKDLELHKAQDELATRTAALTKTERELGETKQSLQEEAIIRQAHAASESRLDRVASGLKTVARQGVLDIDGLFGKLERKSGVLAANLKAVKIHSKTLADEATTLSDQLEDFVRHQQQLNQNLRDQAEQFQRSQIKALSGHSGMVEQQLSKLSDSIGVITAKESMSMEISAALAQMIKETNSSIRHGFQLWETDLKRSNEDLIAGLGESWAKQLGNVDKSLRSFASLVESVVRDAQDHVESERKSIQVLHSLTEQAATAEIKRLQHQNERLLRLVDSEKAVTEKMRNELVSHITSMVHNYVSSRDTSLRDAVNKISAELVDGQHDIEKFKFNHGSGVDGALMHQKELLGRLEKRSSDGRRTRDSGGQALSQVVSGFHDGLVQVQTLVGQASAAQSTVVSKETQALDVASAGALDRLEKSRRARVEHTEALQTETQQSYESLQTVLASTSRVVQETVKGIVSDTTLVRNATQEYRSTTSGKFTGLRHTTRSLVEESTTEDVPTGMTPTKRKWEYVDDWEVVKSREEALRRGRPRHALGLPDTATHNEPMSEVSNSLPSSGSGSDLASVAAATSPTSNRFAKHDAVGEVEITAPTYVEFEVPLIDDDDEEDVENLVPPMAKLPPQRTTTGRVSSRSRVPPLGGTLRPPPARASRRLASGTNIPSASIAGPGLAEKSKDGGARKRVKH